MEGPSTPVGVAGGTGNTRLDADVRLGYPDREEQELSAVSLLSVLTGVGVLTGVATGFAVLGWVSGYCYGYFRGVRDTESRWSEAVARKADRG